MKAHEALAVIKAHRGQTLSAVFQSIVPTLKSVQGVEVVKRTEAHVIGGIELANRKELREAIEAGERGELGPLPWGVWTEYPFIINHKGQDYIRLYPPTQAQMEVFNLKHHIRFFANGEEITRNQAIALCGSKAEARDEEPLCFTVKADNIVKLG